MDIIHSQKILTYTSYRYPYSNNVCNYLLSLFLSLSFSLPHSHISTWLYMSVVHPLPYEQQRSKTSCSLLVKVWAVIILQITVLYLVSFCSFSEVCFLLSHLFLSCLHFYMFIVKNDRQNCTTFFVLSFKVNNYNSCAFKVLTITCTT